MAASLEDIVCTVLGVPAGALREDTSPATLASWTSLRHVQLIAAVEDEFGVRLTGRQARSVRSVGDLRRLLHELGSPVEAGRGTEVQP